MKNFLVALLCFLLLSGCAAHSADQPETEPVQLTVFAAASLTETITQIGAAYTAEHPGTEIVFNFDSSGILKDQILAGAQCHVFLSAGQNQMDAVMDLVHPGTRLNLLENKIVLCVPEGNPKNVTSFDNLMQCLPSGDVLFAMGGADVPAGQYAEQVLSHYGLESASLPSITFGSNSKEVTTWVKEGMADCGVLYATDAFSAGLTVVDTAIEEMCGRVIYPAAVISGAGQTRAALDFLNFLKEESAAAIFQSVGFTHLSE